LVIHESDEPSRITLNPAKALVQIAANILRHYKSLFRLARRRVADYEQKKRTLTDNARRITVVVRKDKGDRGVYPSQRGNRYLDG